MSKDHEVGYGKPPKKNQFKKGQSGNPKGRPKKTRNLSTLMEEELNVKITVKEGSKTVTMSKHAAIVKQLVNKALKGDLRASKAVFDYTQDIEPSPEVLQELNPNEQKIFNEFLEQQSKRNHD